MNIDLISIPDHLQLAVRAMQPGEAALLIGGEFGEYLIPVCVDHDNDFVSACQHIQELAAVERITFFCLVEYDEADDELAAAEIAGDRALELLRDRARRLAREVLARLAERDADIVSRIITRDRGDPARGLLEKELVDVRKLHGETYRLLDDIDGPVAGSA